MSPQVKLTPREPDLWGQRVDELGLRLENGPVGPLIEQLLAELTQAGISLRPAFYVSNEWGCPDGQPLIGVPFYLCDPRLYVFEEEHADDLEDDVRILAGLRHEAGHALNYAYKLYTHLEWERVFGVYDVAYHDDYNPAPFAQRYVRHLPGWYGQKHPDEDFAETFALWLTPGSNWRENHTGAALEKLELVDRMMKEIGQLPPIIDPATVVPDPHELAFTVGEFYEQRAIADAPPVHEIGPALDDDLRATFSAEGLGTDAASLLLDRRQTIMRSVSNYTGSRLYVVKALIDELAARARDLGLRAAHGREVEALIGITAMISTLVANFLKFGHFLPA